MPQNGGYICQWRASCFEDLPPVEFMYLVLIACYVRVTIGDSDFCLPLIFSDQTGEGKIRWFWRRKKMAEVLWDSLRHTSQVEKLRCGENPEIAMVASQFLFKETGASMVSAVSLALDLKFEINCLNYCVRRCAESVQHFLQ